ncbi:sensor histidine kinase [Falsiroseomonas sp. CW058]|uniref:sensor histidine kinase n=1 Tax=Falsiroseomonas sp. CW058 TaxID=3388664 RepID=UPI003D323B14
MPPTGLIPKFFQRSRALPTSARYALSAVLVLAAFGLREAAAPLLPPGYPFAHFLMAVLAASALFDRGSGILATGLSALLGLWFYIPPTGSLRVEDPRSLVLLGLFVVVALSIATVTEALHRAVERLQAAYAELASAHARLDRSERSRMLMLREFRHRTRNDLGALVGLLMLRARAAPSDIAREALREAAEHALALARVHTRLAVEDGPDAGTEVATVDTRDFIGGLCADIEASQFGEGLRPITLAVEAEAHPLASERAVPLGLVLNETVTNAMKYAFPEDRPGRLRVRFARDGADFVLTVVDDGIGLPEEGVMQGPPSAPRAPGSGLGSRLLAGLAAQLRGTFARTPGPEGAGTVTELRFPVALR